MGNIFVYLCPSEPGCISVFENNIDSDQLAYGKDLIRIHTVFKSY